jgi:hypothetical protein
LTDQNQPSITPEEERARLSRYPALNSTIMMMKRRPFAAADIILLFFFLPASVLNTSKDADSGSAPSPAPGDTNTQAVPVKQADGSVCVDTKIGGCPEEWQVLDFLRLKN